MRTSEGTHSAILLSSDADSPTTSGGNDWSENGIQTMISGPAKGRTNGARSPRYGPEEEGDISVIEKDPPYRWHPLCIPHFPSTFGTYCMGVSRSVGGFHLSLVFINCLARTVFRKKDS